MIVFGILMLVLRMKDYKSNPRDAFWEDVLFFFPTIIGGIIMIVAGGGWLFYLLNCALRGKC